MVLNFKDLDKVVNEANPVKSGLVKRREGLEQDMLALIALSQELRNCLLRGQGCLKLTQDITLRRNILVHSVRMV